MGRARLYSKAEITAKAQFLSGQTDVGLVLKDLLGLLAGEFRSAVEEDPGLSTRGKKVLLDVVQHDPLRDEWEVSTSCLSLQVLLTGGLVLEAQRETQSGTMASTPPPATENAVQTQSGPKASTSPPVTEVAHRVVAKRFRRWDMRIKEGLPGADEVLGRRTVAALTTLRDVLRLTGRGVIVDQVEDRALAERTFTEWELEGREPLRVGWFTDVWETFWAVDRFADGWNHAKSLAREVRDSQSETTRRDLIIFLGFAWLAAGIDVLRCHDVDARAGAREGPIIEGVQIKLANQGKTEKRIEYDWERVQRGIVLLSEEVSLLDAKRANNLRLDELRAWFVGVGCLLAPEVGLPRDFLEELGAPLSQRHGRPGKAKRSNADATAFFDTDVGKALKRVWSRSDTGRNIAYQRARRLGRHLLSPLGLAMVNPTLARTLGSNLDQEPAPHPLNSTILSPVGTLELSPSQATILGVLHADRSFSEARLDPQERNVYKSLLEGPTKVERHRRTRKPSAGPT